MTAPWKDELDRRSFVRMAVATVGGLAAANAVGIEVLSGIAGAQVGGGSARYGALGAAPDQNGILLPAGFESRLVAVGGELVPGTEYVWHPFPDGAATSATGDGGWIYVSNSEMPYPGKGGAGAIRFDRQGGIVDAYRVLEGTTNNCSGGMTPWGTWLSGEEIDTGLIWECDATGRREAVARPAMGTFFHEMAACDPRRRVVYLSEDQPTGLLYRFRPTRWGAWGVLGEGSLEAASVDPAGAVSWVPVQDPGSTGGPAHSSAPGATPFAGGEGLVLDAAGRFLYLTTKHDNHVHRFDLETSQVVTIYQGDGVLTGVDNVTVHEPSGDLFVCEDGGDMQIVLMSPDGAVVPFLQVVGQDESEITGIAFDPSGKRLYFSSQRAPTDKRLGDLFDGLRDPRPIGRTFEVTGPFAASVPPVTTTTTKPKRKRRKKARAS